MPSLRSNQQENRLLSGLRLTSSVFRHILCRIHGCLFLPHFADRLPRLPAAADRAFGTRNRVCPGLVMSARSSRFGAVAVAALCRSQGAFVMALACLPLGAQHLQPARIDSIPSCMGVETQVLDGTTGYQSLPRRRSLNSDFRGKGLCFQYSDAGWERPFTLYLGEGAEDHRDLIEQAVGLWSNSFDPFFGSSEPMIKIATSRRGRRNAILPDGFWGNRAAYANEFVGDGASTIYFKPGGLEFESLGFTQIRRDRQGRIVESDLYIDTSLQAEYPDSRMVASQLVLDVDGTNGFFALLDLLYISILHQIGHALGLLHVPVSGNVMSSDYLPRLVDTWKAPAHLYFLSAAAEGSYPHGFSGNLALPIEGVEEFGFVESDSILDILVDMTGGAVSLGDMDRMMLMCVYGFADWTD